MTRIFPTISDAIANSARTAVAPLEWDPATHLLSRFAFGPSAYDRALVRTHGIGGWVTDQIALGRKYPVYSALPEVEKIGPLLAMNPVEVRRWLTRHGREYGGDAMNQLSMATVALQAHSPAQLYETLVDFWANHLNVANHFSGISNTRHMFDRQVIRQHAFGNFTDMLIASSKNPAMLVYLGLRDSTKAHLNENYAREVLELHTVGLNYTEADVLNAAAALVGRTLDSTQRYVFEPAQHKPGRIKVLGFSDPNRTAAGGEAVGDRMLRYLAAHPFTAQNIARKLCVRFVSDDPSAELQQAVAHSYLANHTQILPMIWTILRSDEFWASRGQKIRRPAENVLATVRALGVRFDDPLVGARSLSGLLAGMGNNPLDWPAPDGYPDVAEAWRSSGNLLQTWNIHLALASGYWQGFTDPNFDRMYPRTPRTTAEAIGMLSQYLTGTAFSAEHTAIVCDFLNEPGDTEFDKSHLRWKINAVVGVILDSPHFALR